MEQWERDYLEAIQSRKQNESSSKGYAKEQKEYINACWEEVTRQDGSKWYIPKQDQFNKQKKKIHRKRSFSTVFKKVVRLILALILCFSLFSGFLFLLMQNNTDSINWNRIRSVLRIRNTMVDGLGLRNMANTLRDIEEKQTDTLNAYVLSGYSFSEDEMIQWRNSIFEDLTTIDQLPHDDSYSEVIDCYAMLLETLQTYMEHIEHGNMEMAQTAHSEYSALLSEVHYVFAAALEKNGVEYTLDENGLSFRYYHY